MLYWMAITLTALLASAWLVRPFLSRGQIEVDDTEGAVSVFRDQQDEVARDLAQGLISPEECDEAQREIEARALRAARSGGGGMSVSQRSLPLAGGLAAICAAAAIGGYALYGQPDQPDQPLAERRADVLLQRAAAGDINSRIELLIDRTAENPQSFEDWWILGQSYASIGDYAMAVDALRRAAELGGDDPSVLASYAEAMVLANGNKVPDAARLIFEQVLQGGPEPRARYYVALHKAQAQEFELALQDWAALAAESEADAPWMPLVRRDIVNMVRFTGGDVSSYLPDATPTEIARATGASAGEVATTQIAELEATLADDPVNFEAAIDLAIIRAGLGEDAAARAVLDDARAHFKAAPFVLQKLDETAQSLGLDLLAPGVSGPTAEDVAAASELSAEDQSDMIAGMVAGLAAKLEENPNNPEGWVMLVRSYATMGKPEKAREAYDAALAHYDGQETVLTRLRNEAGTLLPAQ